MRCTLRISQRGILVDGDPRSRAEAVAYCKRTAGAVVVIEGNTRREWNSAARGIVELRDTALEAEWDATRLALEREGVRIYVRGPLCYDPRRLGCRPTSEPTPSPMPEPRRVIVAEPPLLAPPTSE
jgi:hypothetical protein